MPMCIRFGWLSVALMLLHFQLACADVVEFELEDRSDRTPDPYEGDDDDVNPMDLGAAIADARFLSDAHHQQLGWSVASAGDVNGDGFGDLVVGAPGDGQAVGEPDQPGSDPGAAFLFLGPLAGEVYTSGAHAKFLGQGPTDEAGYAVAPAGDLDGDGLDEFLVAAPGARDGDVRRGRVHVAGLAEEGDVDLATETPTILGENTDGFAGFGIAGVGDVDGDGKVDLLVGDTSDSTDAELAGAAYLVLGNIAGDVDLAAATAKLTGEDERDYAGVALSTAGDVDDDGFADLLIGAPSMDGVGAGRAYLVHGPVDGTRSLADAEATLSGETVGDLAGYALAGGEDLNGDGIEDLVVGAPLAERFKGSGRGMAYLVHGPVAGHVSLADADATFFEESLYDWVGMSLAVAGDVDRDGVADLLVGTEWGAYLITDSVEGEVILPDAGFHFHADWSNSLGYAVAAAGDTNGDGYADFALGSYRESTHHQDGGAVYLVYGGERFR